MDNLRESNQVTIDLPESHHVSADLPESHHVSADLPESCDVLSVTSRYSRSVLRFSSVRDAPLVSARAAGIPKPTHSSPPVPELIPLSEVLPMMGIAFWCVWAACTTTELPEVTVATMMSSEVAADAAEPLEVVAFVAMFPEVMVPAAVSPKVAADAAEPPEAAVLSSVPCMVVAPSCALSACHVTVEGTVAELSLYPDSTTVEPPKVAHLLQNLQRCQWYSIMNSRPVLPRPWRPSMNSRPVLPRPWRPSMNSRPVLPRPWRPSMNHCPALSRLWRPSMNPGPALSRL